MTEKTVTISITTEVNGKALKQEISVGSAGLDGELIKMMADLMRTIIAAGLEAIDDQIREREAKDWKNLGREKHRVLTAMGEVEIKRRVYRDGAGKRRKPLDEQMGLGRYQRETNVVRMMGAWLATQNSYRDAADELSYLVKNRITHSKIQRMVWAIGNALADVEEAEINHWDGGADWQEKINTPVLFGESDGVMIALQRERRRKVEARVGIMYTGKKAIGAGRYRLQNKVCMTKLVHNSQEWQQIIQKMADKHYDLSAVKHLITGGDGNVWVKKSFDYISVEQRENVLDRYHLYRASKTALGFSRETIQVVKRMRQHGLPAVIDDLNQAHKNARGRRKERLAEYIQYLESNQDALKDVQLSENGRPLSLGGIEGNVDKLVARRMKGRGRSWRIPGARAMVTLCRYRPQLRDLTLKLTYQPGQPSALKSKKSIRYGSWLQCSLPLFSSSYQNQPWAKELRRNLHDRRVLSMDYL
ncbi:MAG: ISLre2 family transposase [Syntrophobacteria bacterium]